LIATPMCKHYTNIYGHAETKKKKESWLEKKSWQGACMGGIKYPDPKPCEYILCLSYDLWAPLSERLHGRIIYSDPKPCDVISYTVGAPFRTLAWEDCNILRIQNRVGISCNLWAPPGIWCFVWILVSDSKKISFYRMQGISPEQ